MSISSVPPPPKQSKYGWSLADRKEEFRRILEQKNLETHRLADFKGQTLTLPIFRVPINLPKYRISNGRTASAQQEHVAIKKLQTDFFDNGDPELEDVQQAQHLILQKMIQEEGLHAKFKDSANKQVEPIVLDESGFVVNGNRRLCCWRELFWNEQATYNHFSHIDVVVLPHCDDKELDRLEASLQIDKDIRADYSWHAEANMYAQKQRLHGFTTIELAGIYKKPKKTMEELLAMRQCASEYLTSRSKQNEWSEVSDDFYAFQQLIKAMNETKSASDREIIKQASFSLIDNSTDVGGRLYEAIPKVKDNLAIIKQNLAQAFPLPPAQEDATAQLVFGGPTVPSTTASSPSEMVLVAEIKKDKESVAKARNIVIETIRSQDEQIKEKNTADFLLKSLKKANSYIQNACGHGLRPESTKAGVQAQVDAIKTSIATIEAWMAGSKE